MPRVRDQRMVPFVAVLAGALAVFVALVSFGVNTACTNAWSCTSNSCAPCRMVSIASVGGLVVGGVLSWWALVGAGSTRSRMLLHAVAMVATAVMTLVVAQSWTMPSI